MRFFFILNGRNICTIHHNYSNCRLANLYLPIFADDIYLSRSPDLIHWGKHRFVMGVRGGWESTKVGAGPVPIETAQGWLFFYHEVLTSCNGFVYSFGAALLDLDQPWKVIHRGASYLLSPQTYYECVGDVPNVAFPCATLYDPPAGRIAIYYGCADTVTGLAFCKLDEMSEFLRGNSWGRDPVIDGMIIHPDTCIVRMHRFCNQIFQFSPSGSLEALLESKGFFR